MPIPWGVYLDVARCVALIGEEDLGEATMLLGPMLVRPAAGSNPGVRTGGVSARSRANLMT